MPNDINQVIQGIMQMKNAGRNPQQVMQMLLQQKEQRSGSWSCRT